MAECRSCSAPIIWTITERGKKMPVDAEPSPRGTVTLGPERQDDTPLARFFPSAAAAPEHVALYTSHFATCPDRKDWRR